MKRRKSWCWKRSGYVSYANCGLPYYVGDVIQEAGALSVQTPQSLAARFALDVRVHSEVTAIDPARKTVSVRALDSGKTYEESYDKLILAPGARPVVPNLPGVELERVFTLRTVEDTLRIRQFVDSQSPQSATVIGGGFIGLEMAENLRARGLHVTLVEKMDQLLGPLDADMASFVHAKFLSEGVKLLLGSGAAGFEEKDGGIFTRLDNAPGVQADMVVLAIGVAPDSQLARAAGLELGAKGSIAGERAHADVPDGHLRRGRRGADPPSGVRTGNAGFAGWPSQQAGTRGRGQHLWAG